MTSRTRLTTDQIRALLGTYTPKPAYTLNVSDAARVVDSEGTIGVRRRPTSGTVSAYMSVEQNHPGYPVALYRMFGGGLSESSRPPNGRTTVPCTYTWELSRLQPLKSALAALLPVLWEKRPAAVLVLSLIEARARMGFYLNEQNKLLLETLYRDSKTLHKSRPPLLEEWVADTGSTDAKEAAWIN